MTATSGDPACTGPTATRYVPSGGRADGQREPHQAPLPCRPRHGRAGHAVRRGPAGASPSPGPRRRWRPGPRCCGRAVRRARTAARQPPRTPGRAPARPASPASPPARTRTPRRASSGTRPAAPGPGSSPRTPSYVVSRRRWSKWTTTVVSTPAAARRSRRSSGSHRRGGAEPVMISSGWWSKVMTTGRAPRSAASVTRCSSRYACPRWSPSNTPTTTKTGASERGRWSSPRATSISARLPPASASRGVGRPASAGRSASTLCGWRAPETARQTATTRPSGPTASTSGASRGTSGVLGAVISPSPRRRISSSVIGACGRSSRPASIGTHRAAIPAGPSAACSRSTSSGMASSSLKPPDAVLHQRAQVGARLQAGPEVPGQRADVGAGGARDLDDGRRARRIGVVPLQHRQLVDGHVARRQLHGLARARHLVGAAARDLDRAVDRRHLAQRSRHPRERRLDRHARDRRPVDRASGRRRCRPSWTSRRSRSSPGSASTRRGGIPPGGWRGRGRRAARPRRTGRASRRGPTRRVDESRRTSPTTSCEVGPDGLATTSTPSRPPLRSRGLTAAPRRPSAPRPRARGRSPPRAAG